MERLSQELIFRIASFLERSEDQSDIPLCLREKTQSKLLPYATLSREWQYAIEYRTFRVIRLKSPELPYFSQVLSGHRRAFLSSFLQLLESPSLPTLSQISSFRVYAHHSHHIEPRSAVLLATKLRDW